MMICEHCWREVDEDSALSCADDAGDRDVWCGDCLHEFQRDHVAHCFSCRAVAAGWKL